MHLLVLGVFALLPFMGEVKTDLPKGPFPLLQGEKYSYLEPNDVEKCKGKLYKPEYQLPLPKESTSVYGPVKTKVDGKEKISSYFPKDTITAEGAKSVIEAQTNWLKELIFKESILKKLLLNKLNEDINSNIEMKEIFKKIKERKLKKIGVKSIKHHLPSIIEKVKGLIGKKEKEEKEENIKLENVIFKIEGLMMEIEKILINEENTKKIQEIKKQITKMLEEDKSEEINFFDIDEIIYQLGEMTKEKKEEKEKEKEEKNKEINIEGESQEESKDSKEEEVKEAENQRKQKGKEKEDEIMREIKIEGDSEEKTMTKEEIKREKEFIKKKNEEIIEEKKKELFGKLKKIEKYIENLKIEDLKNNIEKMLKKMKNEEIEKIMTKVVKNLIERKINKTIEEEKKKNKNIEEAEIEKIKEEILNSLQLDLNEIIKKIKEEKEKEFEVKEIIRKIGGIKIEGIKIIMKELGEEINTIESTTEDLFKTKYLNKEEFDKFNFRKRFRLALRERSKKKIYKNYKIEAKAMKERTKRSCFIFDINEGCKIDTSERYKPYEPNFLYGLHLARGKLLSSHWIEPDFDDVSLYENHWHTDSVKEEKLTPNHDDDKDDPRVIDRCSFYGKYIVHNKYPINPVARTGFVGRGDLGQWGPSKGVGGILWLTNENGEIEFLGVEMGKYENTDYARICTPGGFVDLEEDFEYASKRELVEESLGIKKEKDEELFNDKMYKMGEGELVIFGINDSRKINTDNAWTESVVYAFNIELQDKKEFVPKAGSDAKKAMWITVKPGLKILEEAHEAVFNDKSKNENSAAKLADKKFIEMVTNKMEIKDTEIYSKVEEIVESKINELLTIEKRIDYILNNFQACWTEEVKEVKKEEKAKKPTEDKATKPSEKDQKPQVKELCFKLNAENIIHMEDLGRLILVKKYGEMKFENIIKKIRSNQAPINEKRPAKDMYEDMKKQSSLHTSQMNISHPKKARGSSPTRGSSPPLPHFQERGN